jgi:uncharacterized membrane protein HdeD (DUF308 family)
MVQAGTYVRSSGMESGDNDPFAPGLLMARSWLATVILGALTVILGLVVTFHPGGSLNVVAVLLGITMICSGLFHLVRIFGPGESHIWLGITGLLLIVIGVVLIRHLHLTLALIGLFVGISWIVQGATALISGLAGPSGEGRGWWIAFGVISMIAGIIVVASPVSSVTFLAALLGIWFIVIGLFEIIAGFMLRRAASAADGTLAHHPA